jgi:hypothetical protein
MAEKIRIEHITNSLQQMERWSKFLRMALYKLDPKMPVSPTDSKQFASTVLSPPPLADGCPPVQADEDPDCVCPECGHHHHHHHGHGKGKGHGGKKKGGDGDKKRKTKPK